MILRFIVNPKSKARAYALFAARNITVELVEDIMCPVGEIWEWKEPPRECLQLRVSVSGKDGSYEYSGTHHVVAPEVVQRLRDVLDHRVLQELRRVADLPLLEFYTELTADETGQNFAQRERAECAAKGWRAMEGLGGTGFDDNYYHLRVSATKQSRDHFDFGFPFRPLRADASFDHYINAAIPSIATLQRMLWIGCAMFVEEYLARFAMRELWKELAVSFLPEVDPLPLVRYGL